MAKKWVPQIGPKIRSDRDFQSRLIANMQVMNERLWNIQAALACVADWVQIASPKIKLPKTKFKIDKEALKAFAR